VFPLRKRLTTGPPRPPDRTPARSRPIGVPVALLRCTSVRFVVYYFLAYYCALAGTGGDRARWVALGTVYWFLHSTATEALNRVADQPEDRINRPERTLLCLRVGYPRLRRVAVAGYVLLAALGVGWVVALPSLPLAVLLVLANFFSINYSYGLRLCRYRFLSLLVLTFPFMGTFCIGWTVGRSELDSGGWADFAAHGLPLVVVGGLALGTLSGVKDLTDVVGDRRQGYRSGWLWLVRGRAAVVAAAVGALPFAVLASVAAAGALPTRDLWLLVFLPVALLLANASRVSRHPAEHLAVREFFYNYWAVFVATLTVLHVARPAAAVTALSCLAVWRLASRHLHWAEDTSTAWFWTVLRLRARPSGRPGPGPAGQVAPVRSER
jgi:4-hydroxybenzoate polyprenyltransferase